MVWMKPKALGLTLAVLLTAVSVAQAWYPYAERYRKWQAKRPFTMAGFHNGLPMDKMPERIARFKAAGLNMLLGHEFHTWHWFEAAREAGMDWATQHPARFASSKWRWGHDGSTAEQVIARAIRQTPGCSFIQVSDSPTDPKYLDDIGAFSKWVHREFPGVLTSCVLALPRIDHDLYVKKTHPDVFLYYDPYPLGPQGFEMPHFLRHMAWARASARRNRLPLWMYLQAAGANRKEVRDGKRIPDQADMRYLMFTFLAHGGKGALFFLYYGGWGGPHIDPTVVIDPVADHGRGETHWHRYENSMRTRAWWAIRDVAPEVKVLSRALLNLRTKDPIAYTGTVPEKCKPFEGHGKLRAVANRDNPKEGVLVGFFDDQAGQEYFMVVNLKHGENMSKMDGMQTLRLTFDASAGKIERLNRLTGRVETLRTKADGGSRILDVRLEGGTGDLFKWSTGKRWTLREASP